MTRRTMIAAPLLHTIESAGEAVLTLSETLEEAEFRRSRLVRPEVQRQLCLMGDTLGAMPPEVLKALPEIDWEGWRAHRRLFEGEPPASDDAMWFAMQSLVPATLNWLRVYKQSQPELFDYR